MLIKTKLKTLTGYFIIDIYNLMLLLNSKSIIFLGIIAFLAMSFWSLISMPMDMNGKMVNCPFMDGSASFCQMSISEHISAWQRFFTMIRENNLLLSLFSLLAIVSIGVVISNEFEDKTRDQRLRHYLYRYKPEIKLFNHLELAFSDGLIHSKIYA